MGPARPSGISWSWAGALLGATYAIPAALVTLDDVSRGVAFAVGVIPAAAIGLAPRRRDRRAATLVGALAGAAIFLGSLLAPVPALAVAGIFGVAVGATALSRRAGRAGPVLVTLGVPMVAVGFSYTDTSTAAGLALLMLAGSLYAYLASLVWPEGAAPQRPRPAVLPFSLGYGVRLGLAGATAAAIGFALDLEHVGWACAAALLVMRPSAEMQTLRSVGRIASVVAGALAGVVVVSIGPPVGVYSVLVVAVIAGIAGTHGSRWYITAAFTTFLVFVLLLSSEPDTAGARFGERVGETVLGVGLAYLFGVAWPALTRSRR